MHTTSLCAFNTRFTRVSPHFVVQNAHKDVVCTLSNCPNSCVGNNRSGHVFSPKCIHNCYYFLTASRDLENDGLKHLVYLEGWRTAHYTMICAPLLLPLCVYSSYPNLCVFIVTDYKLTLCSLLSKTYIRLCSHLFLCLNGNHNSASDP